MLTFVIFFFRLQCLKCYIINLIFSKTWARHDTEGKRLAMKMTLRDRSVATWRLSYPQRSRLRDLSRIHRWEESGRQWTTWSKWLPGFTIDPLRADILWQLLPQSCLLVSILMVEHDQCLPLTTASNQL